MSNGSQSDLRFLFSIDAVPEDTEEPRLELSVIDFTVNEQISGADTVYTPVAERAVVTPEEAEPPEEGEEADEAADHWIAIELVDEDDQPVGRERYSITLPDGSVNEGTLDQNGFARVEGIEPGTCQITFPDLDRDVWARI